MVWYQASNEENWQVVRKSTDKTETFQAVFIDPEKQSVLVLHNHNRNEIVLQEFDPITKTFGDVIFEKPGIDLKNVILNAEYTDLAAVNYLENGILRKHYFNKDTELTNNTLKALFPHQQAIVVSKNLTAEQKIVLTFNHENRAKYFHLDTTTNQLTLISSIAPNLTGNINKSRIVHHKIPTSDGFEI